MFYYRIYGLIVRCNVDMSLLMPVEETEYYDMEISVLYNKNFGTYRFLSCGAVLVRGIQNIQRKGID